MSKTHKKIQKIFVLCLLIHGIFGCNSRDEKNDKTEGDSSVENGNRHASTFGFWTREDSVLSMKVSAFFDTKAKAGFNGVVLVGGKGKVLFKKSYGYQANKRKDSLTTESAFSLASVSKTITSTAVLQLIQAGKCELTDSLAKFFPEFDYPGVTIEHLLSHRSGLSEYMYFAQRPEKDTSYTHREVLEQMIVEKPAVYWKADYKYNYRNTNYALLAVLVEKLSRKDFKEYVRDSIFAKCEMSNACFFADTLPRLDGFTTRGRKVQSNFLDYVFGDKGVYASVEDLWRFDQSLHSGRLLSDSVLEQAYTTRHPELYNHDNYGLGWRVDKSDSIQKVIYHTGWWHGNRTYFIRTYPETYTLIALSNRTRVPFGTGELKKLIKP